MSIFKYKLSSIFFRGLLIAVLLVTCLSKAFEKGSASEQTEVTEELETASEEKGGGNVEDIAVFKITDGNLIAGIDDFNLQDCFIKNKITVLNCYYIDDRQRLWGYGDNSYGQLGIGDIENGQRYDTPMLIAENVVSVDSSSNGLFCIYLTSGGELYGMGSNMLGLLGQEYSTELDIGGFCATKVTSPVLLMKEVAYARAGKEAIVALKEDGSVWWWGQYRSTYGTQAYDDVLGLYWKAIEDEANPVKMFAASPQKVLEDCVYAVTGDTVGAAIRQNGELYTWGLNIFGECGTEVTKDDFQRAPEKVLDNVKMVWIEKIGFGEPERAANLLTVNRMNYDTTYSFNIFAQLEDGNILGAGQNIGEKVKEINFTGDIVEKASFVYSDAFIPVILELYSEPENRKKLSGLMWGTDVEVTEKFLANEGLWYTTLYDENGYYIAVEDSRYLLFYDEGKKLDRIWLRDGGSRNLLFQMGMSWDEVEDVLESSLSGEVTKYGEYTVYWTEEVLEGSYYGFVFENNALIQIWERGA